jgi:hypothetical protein
LALVVAFEVDTASDALDRTLLPTASITGVVPLTS